jgi:DNA-binding CsgD family transcriptional regulator
MRRSLTDEIPLVRREAEIDRIIAKLKGPTPAAFVLAGAAGVGKTRLASEAAKSAARLGFSTAQAVASRAAASIPFGPFAPFLPEAAPSAGGLLGLLRQASDAIAGRAGPDGKLLLLVDDAQHLDDGSAALVQQLVQARTCSVLLSLRTPGPAPEPVTALWKDGLAERIDLVSWTEPETEAMIAAALGGPISRSTARQLWQVSRGNAFYLRELLIGTASTGALIESGGIWSLHEPLSTPDRLVELVASRLAGLTPDAIAVIELLAIGEPLGMSMLEKLASSDGLDAAEAQGFVQVSQDERRMEARLAHPIYGEAVRQSMPRSRLRRLSSMLAAAIEAAGARRRQDLLRLGRWQLDAGGHGDPIALTRAARRAQEMFDMELSTRLAQAAMDSGAGVEAGLLLGEARFRSGHPAEAESVLAQVAQWCQTDRDVARIANARAYNLFNALDAAAAAAVLDDALAVVTTEGPRLQLLGRLATNRMIAGDPEGALAAAAPLLASDDHAIFSRASYVSSIALALIGRSGEAIALADEGLRRHRQATGVPQLPEVQLIGRVFAHAAAGRLTQAEDDAAAGEQACLLAGDMEGHATGLFMIGFVLIERGHLGRAASLFRDGASVNRKLNELAALRWCLSGVVLAEAMSGHAELAHAAAAERDKLPAGSLALYETDLIGRSRAWVCAAGGEQSRACEILTEAAARAAASRLCIAEARLLHDVARLGQPGVVAARLAELAQLADGEFVAAMAGHAEALAAGNAADLEATGRAFEVAGASLLAAEAYTSAAAAYRSDGLARLASASARKADEMVLACGDVRTPGLAMSGGPEGLTRREREVAGLAAAGASSREIAAKLYLSVRTVDNHLQNVYGKLGVTSREELARILRS